MRNKKDWASFEWLLAQAEHSARESQRTQTLSMLSFFSLSIDRFPEPDVFRGKYLITP